MIDEEIFDRWKRADELGFGKGTSIYEHALVYGRPKVGMNVWIGPFSILDGTGGLTIGTGCHISSGVMIFSHSTHLQCVTSNPNERVEKPVVIEDYVYIGSGAIVLPGVRIGHHSIIGAGAVVSHEIPSHSIAVGVPAKPVGKIRIKNGKASLQYFQEKQPNEEPEF